MYQSKPDSFTVLRVNLSPEEKTQRYQHWFKEQVYRLLVLSGKPIPSDFWGTGDSALEDIE